MSSEPPPDDPDDNAPYQVGFGKPPRATRFQPGRSGNPRGRPRGSRKRPVNPDGEPLKTMQIEEAYRPIQIRDGDTLVEMPTAQAVWRNLTLTAAKGNQRSQRMFLDIVGGIESERRRERIKLFETAVLAKAWGEEKIAQARRLGLPTPKLFPHPDHLIIDPKTGSVKVRGPATPEEKVELDGLSAMKADLQQRLADLEAERRAFPRRQSLGRRIANLYSVIAKIDTRLNLEWVLLEGLS